MINWYKVIVHAGALTPIALALWDIQPEELDGYFPELRRLVAECQFSDCTHMHEPGCAVIEAVETGFIHPERYESYRRMRFGEE